MIFDRNEQREVAALLGAGSMGCAIVRRIAAGRTVLLGDISEPAYNEAVQRLREMSDLALNEQPAYPAQLLLLSTCSYHTEDGRFVVAAYLR